MIIMAGKLVFTRKSYKKMHKVPSLDTEKYIEDLKKRHAEMI